MSNKYLTAAFVLFQKGGETKSEFAGAAEVLHLDRRCFIITEIKSLCIKKSHPIERVNGEVEHKTLQHWNSLLSQWKRKKNQLVINLMKDYLKPLQIRPQLKMLLASLIKLQVTVKS